MHVFGRHCATVRILRVHSGQTVCVILYSMGCSSGGSAARVSAYACVCVCVCMCVCLCVHMQIAKALASDNSQSPSPPVTFDTSAVGALGAGYVWVPTDVTTDADSQQLAPPKW